jgi:hypothetical protein
LNKLERDIFRAVGGLAICRAFFMSEAMRRWSLEGKVVDFQGPANDHFAGKQVAL